MLLRNDLSPLRTNGLPHPASVTWALHWAFFFLFAVIKRYILSLPIAGKKEEKMSFFAIPLFGICCFEIKKGFYLNFSHWSLTVLRG